MAFCHWRRHQGLTLLPGLFFTNVIVYSSCLVTLCFPKISCYLNIYSNCFYQNETLIAIKAPHGTTLEVPDPDEVIEEQRRLTQEVHFVFLLAKFSMWLFSNLYQAVDYPQRRYRVVLRSTMGPIDVYLVRYCSLYLVTRPLHFLLSLLSPLRSQS